MEVIKMAGTVVHKRAVFGSKSVLQDIQPMFTQNKAQRQMRSLKILKTMLKVIQISKN